MLHRPKSFAEIQTAILANRGTCLNINDAHDRNSGKRERGERSDWRLYDNNCILE